MSTLEILSNALEPFKLIGFTLLFIPPTILASFTTERHATTSFQNRWFARFWHWFGPLTVNRNEAAAAPLLNAASGAILDIGTGAGHFLHLYDKSKVTKLVAVETNREHHANLLKSARDAGLQDRFEIASVPVEELTRTGVEKGSFNAVVTLHVLCSAGEPQAVARAGYELLKPGGRWFVFEHVRTQSENSFVRLWQSSLNVIWPFFLGGCQLTRETGRTLRSAGKWREDTLGSRPGDSPYAMIPDIMGVLVKA